MLILLSCASPVDKAREAARAGELDQAVERLESYLSSNPDSAAGLEALGDVHLEAALDRDRDRDARVAAALDAYRRAHEAQPLDGVYRAKLALAQLLTADETGTETARQAWSRSREPAALPMVDDPVSLAEAVERVEWTPASWRRLPSWGEAGGGRFVVRQDGTPVRAEEDGGAPGALDAMYVGQVREIQGDRVLFDDRASPRYAPATGYVDGRVCDQPWGGLACRGRLVHDREVEIHAGPCWHATEERAGEDALDPERLEADQEAVDPDRVRDNSVRCQPGRPEAQDDGCPDLPGSCQVRYERIDYPALSVASDRVWLVPAGAPSPVPALERVDDPAIRDHLASGELATGLPEPLVRWAVRPDGRLPDRWTLDAGHLSLTWTGPDGTFTVRDGILSAWEPR